MSFILDALRKAERDRNLGQAPRLEDVAMAQERTAATTEPPESSTRLLRIAVLVLFVVVAVLAYLLLHKALPTPAAVIRPLPAGTITATVRGPASVDLSAQQQAPAEVAAADEDATPAIAADEDISSLDDLSQPASSRSAAVATAAPADVTVVRREDFIARAEPPPDMPIASIESPEEFVAEEPRPRRQQAPAVEAPVQPAITATDPDAPATPLSDMPANYRAGFPALSVEVHVWDDDPARRFVLINGKRYQEGSTLAAGPRLVGIAQEGLVLEFHGQRVMFSLQ